MGISSRNHLRPHPLLMKTRLLVTEEYFSNICISLTKRNVKHFKPLLLERSILTVEYIMLALLLSTVEPLYSGHAL